MTHDRLETPFPPQQQDHPGLTDAMQPRPDHGETSYRGTGRLAGRAALITGGDSGIGRAVAIAYAREGADVALTHLPEEADDAAETVRWVEDAGRRALAIEVDLRAPGAAEDLVARVVAESGLGRLDVLVNNAGYQWARAEGLEDIDDERIARTLDTNLGALLRLTRAALPHLRERPGCVVNCGSIQAYEPSSTLLDYAATKAGIANLTVSLAGLLGADGIRVNCVAPGPIWTPLQPATQTAEKVARFGENTPLGRAGQPAEVAPAFVFLASPSDASYVSGTVLGVTGGRGVF
ncbi:SDR family oxidoreductase [Nocardioides sp. TRM66260-LWL]|uniref:SDR family oxidoreductase n=1 Tax=Nocardioides sp. TRM66260-LWL TaxID=2874478 RepID=UPI001CC6F88E|nr:SDR family oxidoreductase [Nocardioides sp. TRM66260-LWL]MBZ5735266.1 SDR family oxidoreductase [Nocardioides sp. TRM66260-LWL]